MIPREGLGDFTQVDESELDVVRTTDVQTMLFSFCGYSSGVMPFCIRVHRKFIPAGADYEKEYDIDGGNDKYVFTWLKGGDHRRVVLRIMDDTTCEVLHHKLSG